DESQASVRRALALQRTPETAPHQAYALVIAGELCNWAGDYADALTWLEQGAHVAREYRMLLALLEGVWAHAVALVGYGDSDRAASRFNDAQTLCEKLGDEVFNHRILNSRGWLAAEQGDLTQALALNSRGAEAARSRGDPETISNAELN